MMPRAMARSFPPEGFTWTGNGLLMIEGELKAREPRHCPAGAPCLAPEEFHAPLPGVQIVFD